MTEQEFARWMREEHATVQTLSNKIREAVAVIPKSNFGGWLKEVRDRFEHFRAHLTRHMAMEEQQGYLRAVVEERPTLALEVERLNHEHIELARIMDDLHMTLQTLSEEDRLQIRDCCSRISALLSYNDHHENDENLLITFVFTHDIGTKD